MIVSIHPEALSEYEDAARKYERERPGLGARFSVEAERAIERIRLHPDAWPRIYRRYRKCNITGFPYGIVYATQKEQVKVFAFMHLRRRPGYWRHRT